MINIGNNGNNHSVLNQSVKSATQAESKVNAQKQSDAKQSALPLEQKVSQQARSLESLQQELHKLPEVDLARVNEIRAQLLKSEYSIDLNDLAGAIQSTHQRD
jgi:negative regulator of flagellin synthesis FlgM